MQVKAGESKEAGVRFTPKELALRLAGCVFDALDGRPAGAGILDPACGEGELLIAAWHIGKTRGLRPEQLFGIESNPARAMVARERLAREIGPAAASNIHTGDALAPESPWPGGTHVLANPPWISLSGRQAARGEARAAFERTSGGQSGWPSLHGAFLERIARHIGESHTRAAVLLPAGLCDLDGYAPIRGRVTSHARIAGPPDALDEDAFPGVTEPAVLIELEAWPAAPAPSEAAWAEGSAASAPLIEALANHPRLPHACFGDIGVHSGNSARQLIVDADAALPPIREGRDLRAYELGAPRLRLNTQLERSSERRFRYSPIERYQRIPVLVRQTADRPIAALHTEPTYFRNTLLACMPPVGPGELDPAFVVAVLNSTVASAWHRLRFRDARQRAFPQVKIAHLRALPFPIERRSDAPRMHDRVVEMVRQGSSKFEIEREVDAAYALNAAALPKENTRL